MTTVRFNCLIFIIILMFGCGENNPQNDNNRVRYYPSEKDSLSYLVKNSDLICILRIVEGNSDNTKLSLVLNNLDKVATAKVVEQFKGDYNEGISIPIKASPVYNSPGDTLTLLVLKQGEYIGFLSEGKEVFQPLTSFSLIDIDFDEGRPIWKQSHSEYLDRPVVSKQIIISEIKEEISRQR